MTSLIVHHEVDDVQHWLASTKRAEVFGPLGITFRTFVDPENPNRVGGLVEVPDIAVFQEFMQSAAAAEAMAHDGVRPDTVVVLVEG